MPSKASTQVSPRQNMKQQTLSSFFRPKNSPSQPNSTTGSNGPKRSLGPDVDNNDSDIENTEPSPKKRRPEAVEEEAVPDDDDEPPSLQSPAKAALGKESMVSSDRTARFVYSGSPVHGNLGDDNDKEARERKEKMHQRFVRKLGRPDSIAEIKRRNHLIPAVDTGEAEEDEEADEEPVKKGKSKAGAGKLTPMEKQYLDIKQKHTDKIIIYQVGYKYRFFGEDARIAGRVLGLVCIPGKFRYDEHASEAHLDRFASASFPLARLHVHVKRLIAAGHKVGIVDQVETPALKAAGDNKNTPFIRKLTHVYTRGTYVDDLDGMEASTSTQSPSTGYLLCLTESNVRPSDDEKVHVGILAVQPATGSVLYDDFEDGFMRSEIETRLLHISPCEYLIVGDLSGATDKLIKHLSGSKSNIFGVKARVERVNKSKTTAAESHTHVSKFYSEQLKNGSSRSSDFKSMDVLDKVHRFSERVTVCLSAMIDHLTEYGLEHVFDLTTNFQAFSARTHMLLNGNTLNSLEIYTNQTDHTEKGSLFWTLDRTKTRFGRRLLRNWVGRPLLDQKQIEDRVSSVEELTQPAVHVDKLRQVLSLAKSDLEKILIRIYYKRASRPELLGFLQTMQRISGEHSHVTDASKAGFKSQVINEAVAVLPKINEHVTKFLDRIQLQAAKDDDKYSFFREEENEFEDITNHKLGIACIEGELDEYRREAARILGKKKIEYATVSGIDYLIEVENKKDAIQKVPASWIKISNTKARSRFHTPDVLKLIRQRDQHKEALAAACDEAFKRFLTEISIHYQALRDCIQTLALLDCLFSLAEIALQPGYNKPTFTSDSRLVVSQGRHPMVEQLLLDAYVANDLRLASDEQADPRGLLVTGPNMGGKSSYVRSVALIAIMGQIGSYVPAERAELGMLDAVFTRMGAFDNMMRGESTFMVELSETSDILKQATSRSLVILDELGRGTSTHDGVAIAEAVLRELMDRKIMTLFITHYQDLARLESNCDGLRNVHMRFQEGGVPGEEEITFLYEVGEGVAHRSYGLNVARLANVPRSVIDIAAIKSRELEESIEKRKIGNLSRTLVQLCRSEDQNALERAIFGIEHL